MKKLLLSISAFGLMGYATSLYAMYKGDCLEMMCQWGCKEDANGNAIDGKCCPQPTKTSCIAEQKEQFGCVTVRKIECPLDKFCASDGSCKPCSTADSTPRRLTKESKHCSCPTGYSKRCGSTRTDKNCLDGGDYVCANGCFDHTDCPAEQQCSCVGRSCPKTGGTCQPCPQGTHRGETSATVCMPCTGCQTWDVATQTCLNQCPEGQFCGQLPGGSAPNCGGDTCMPILPKDKLVKKLGSINERSYYIPPPETQWRMTHTSASRFCEYYGMHLATIDEACMKDFNYDSGHDCPNFVSVKKFQWGSLWFNLADYNTNSSGDFWLADLDGNNAMRVTHSCGNNHQTNICNMVYPLCAEN
ncbi:MAG: hypothetical protein E7021_04090 [Alphaproteobacteria bacterium]|nr:hypothetical protein [Alphaproteobacteria bacterium]